VIGSGMTGFALNVHLAQVLYPTAEQRAELALAFTALNLGFTIPFVFGGPLAGAWADRHDRKQIMIVTNGLITLLTFVLMLSGSLQLWMLVCIGALVAAASAFHYAAFDASYAMLVPDRLLPRANGMMQTTWSLSGIVSPALAALIIALPGLAQPDAGLLASLTRIRSRSGNRIRRASCRDRCSRSAVLSLGPYCQSRRPLEVSSPAFSTLGMSWQTSG
jgi:MFS transporter, DHA3 family, macrolide efflux protein